jgi:hypothetical protein
MRGLLRAQRYDPAVGGWTSIELSANDFWDRVAELAGQMSRNT